MADLSITIQNRLSVSGPSPTNKWGAFNWGENWGESGDGYFTVGKNLSAGVSFSDNIDVTLTKVFGNSLSIGSRINFGTLTDGSGYAYVFPDGVTDIDDRYIPTWTEASEPTQSFSEASEPSTTWTDA